MPLRQDTIAAIATPLGEGGISVVRVSGPEAVRIVARRFVGATDLCNAETHTIHVGFMQRPDGTTIDQIVCSLFLAPRSYTGEHVVEVGCHGGMLVTRRVLEELLASGARHATPGEFTQRAFLNGKMDLAQAEAVAELIHASSDRGHRTSLSHLQGEFSARIEAMRGSLMEALGLLELELDFAEDGYEFVDKRKITDLVESTLVNIRVLLSSYDAGKIIREGVRTVLIGAPNVGKSSIMNRLLKENRAIVTDIPGTTRDVISEGIMIEGVLFQLSDTAGIRGSSDPVEQEGIKKSREKLGTADVILLVFDTTRPTDQQISEIGAEALDLLRTRKSRVQVAFNKVDIAKPGSVQNLRGLEDIAQARTSQISARTGEGIQELEKALLSHVPGIASGGAPEGEIVTSARHHEAFLRVERSLMLSLASIADSRTGEFIAVDLRDALDSLGEITGKVTNEDVLNQVFSKFCIGK